jgi:hypothetical protein
MVLRPVLLRSARAKFWRLCGLPLVAVMKPADFRNRDNRPSGRW